MQFGGGGGKARVNRAARRSGSELCEQFASRDEVVRLESLGEGGVDAGDEAASLVGVPSVSKVAGQAQCRAQFEGG